MKQTILAILALTITAAAQPLPTPNSGCLLCSVPNLVGLTCLDAKHAWRDAGFTTPIFFANYGDEAEVTYQSLPAGNVTCCHLTPIGVEVGIATQ